MSDERLIQGNEACAYGALYAGCRFYAGYPITPSSEIMEIMSREMPKLGGVFMQMEDELASISAVIGAAWGGAKAMTATSGPGFSLMQEGIGYAAMTETPCVIVDSQRGGPSTGQPTKTAQADVMQAIWGTHGDHPVIVLTASHVRDVFEMTVQAFNYAVQYRTPVILLLDEVLSHMREKILMPKPGQLQVIESQRPSDIEDFKPFEDLTFLPFGSGARFNVTGMAHDERGFPVQGEIAGRQLQRIVNKIQQNVEKLALYDGLYLGDASVLVVAYGITSRTAESAVEALRVEGVRASLLNLKTLWPFPSFLIEKLASQMDYIIVPELNLGQLVREVERAVRGQAIVKHLGRVDGSLIAPQQIYETVLKFVRSTGQREGVAQ